MSIKQILQYKCFYCDEKENLKLESIQVGGDTLLVNLCPKHYAEEQKGRERTRENYIRQFGNNWH